MSDGRLNAAYLVRVDLVPPVTLGDAADNSRIAGERKRRERPLAHDDGMDEFDCYVRGIRGRGAVAEDQQSTSGSEPFGHVTAGQCESLRVVSQRQQRCHAALERTDDPARNGVHPR